MSDTKKISTWFARKASVENVLGRVLKKLLSEQQEMQRPLKGIAFDDQRWDEWRSIVRRIEHVCANLRAVSEAAPIPEVQREKRHSKRADMKKLPADWRELIIDRMPKYAPATLVAAVTGCRPDELVRGISLTIEVGELVAHIAGSKVTAKTGQAWRKLRWPTENASALVQRLISLVMANPVSGAMRVDIKNARAFSGAVRAAGVRQWPTRTAAITPYCFRHQAAGVRVQTKGAEMNIQQMHPPLANETRSHVDTACAAFHLSRRHQTMRTWACHENGPLRPIRINGRLAWSVAEIKRLLGF